MGWPFVRSPKHHLLHQPSRACHRHQRANVGQEHCVARSGAGLVAVATCLVGATGPGVVRVQSTRQLLRAPGSVLSKSRVALGVVRDLDAGVLCGGLLSEQHNTWDTAGSYLKSLLLLAQINERRHLPCRRQASKRHTHTRARKRTHTHTRARAPRGVLTMAPPSHKRERRRPYSPKHARTAAAAAALFAASTCSVQQLGVLQRSSSASVLFRHSPSFTTTSPSGVADRTCERTRVAQGR